MFKSIPQGFVKLNMELSFNQESSLVLENEVLRMMVRDYYILYTKRNRGDDFFVFNFYCQSGKQEIISYHIGIYCQVFIRFHSKNQLSNSTHKVPDGFPECIQIETTKKQIR